LISCGAAGAGDNENRYFLSSSFAPVQLAKRLILFSSADELVSARHISSGLPLMVSTWLGK
jgi:hypothetical protein